MPSRKIIYLAVAAILVIVVAFIYKYHGAEGVLGEKSLTYEASQTPVPCPEDQLTPGNPCVNEAIKTVVEEDSGDRGNLTKNLSKSFFTSYLNAQDETGDVSTDDRLSIIQSSLSTTPSSTVPVKYILGSLDITDSPNQAEIRAYGNEFAQIYRDNLAAYVSLNTPTYEESANYYKNLAEALSRVKVPQAMAETHLNILNSYNQMYVALLDLDNYDEDPLKGFYAMVSFRNNQNILPTFLAKMANYFKSNGIIFSKSEPGSFWNSS